MSMIALGQPEVLHPRVAAVRRHRRLVRADLREVDADVAPAVAARRDLRPDDAAERLVAREGAAVVDRAHREAEHRPVRLHRHLDVEERALVAVRVRRVLVGPPLRPLHGPVQLAREQAARDVLRVQRDLVAEAAADVLGDEAQLVDADAQRGRHPDRADARHLVVAVDRPLPGAAVELDEARRSIRAESTRSGRSAAARCWTTWSASASAASKSPQSKTPYQTMFEPASSWRTTSSFSDSSPSRTWGSGSYSTSTSSAASRAKLAGARDDGGDRLADVAHAADRERVVLDVRAGRRRELEERIGEDRDLVSRERSVDAVELERLRRRRRT